MTNNRFLTILFFFLFFLYTSSQELQGYSTEISEDYTLYVYEDQTHIRKGRGAEFEILDQLKAGTKVYIVNGSESWPFVAYKKGDEWLSGFIYRYDLSQPLRRGNTKFMYNIQGIEVPMEEDEEGNLLEVRKYNIEWKILEKDSLILKTILPLCNSLNFYGRGNASSAYARVYSGLGLKNIKNVLRVGIPGEACAVPSDYCYYGWTGKELLEFPSRYMAGDDSFAYIEEFIFPAEKGGQAGMIIKKIENQDRELGEVYKTVRKTEKFSWDGKTYKRVK